MKRITKTLLCVSLLLATGLVSAVAQQSPVSFKEVRRYAAREAHQGVAVGPSHVYAVTNRAIGKYDKATGQKVDEWVGAEDGPIIHLNSCIVRGGKLYCAHSNFPGVPMVSSIEIWDTTTMEHTDTHSFGIFAGSATWADYHAGSWWVSFAHYAGEGGAPGKDPRWTTLYRFDDQWRPLERWVYPEAVIERVRPYSISGGVWGTDSLLYVTGHHEPFLYVLRLPEVGSRLQLVRILETSIPGQAVAWDAPNRLLYGIDRKRSEVIVLERAP